MHLLATKYSFADTCHVYLLLISKSRQMFAFKLRQGFEPLTCTMNILPTRGSTNACAHIILVEVSSKIVCVTITWLGLMAITCLIHVEDNTKPTSQCKVLSLQTDLERTMFVLLSRTQSLFISGQWNVLLLHYTPEKYVLSSLNLHLPVYYAELSSQFWHEVTNLFLKKLFCL